MDKSVIRYVIYYITFVFTSLMLLFIDKPETKHSKKIIILYVLCITIVWTVKLLVDIFCPTINLLIYNVAVLVALYLILLMFTHKPLASLLVIIYDFALSLISALLKNISLSKGITQYFLIDTVFLIDYYILLVISMLYRELKIRKEV